MWIGARTWWRRSKGEANGFWPAGSLENSRERGAQSSRERPSRRARRTP
jgi:hypothetical protein